MKIIAKEKAQLRINLRKQRAELEAAFCRQAAQQISAHFSDYFSQTAKPKIAYYWPIRNEVDPRPLIQQLKFSAHYLPVLNKESKVMQFYAYQEGDALELNSFNIPEPKTLGNLPIATEELSMVLVPLLGFDLKGNRLGMGAGYYDHSFASLKSKPLLIGLAYEFQKLAHIPSDNWDIGLDYVVTEKGIYCFL